MHLNKQDLTVIKMALTIAQKFDHSQQASYSYREVLAKLANGGFYRPGEAENRYAERDDRSSFDYDDAAEI